MALRSFILISLFVFCTKPIFAQSTSPSPAPIRSHVERFSTIETRAERVEAEGDARLALNPNDAEALNSRAVARLFLGRYSEAQEDLRRAISLKPGNSAYQANLGSALWKLGRVDEAIAAERAAIKLDDKNFTAQYQLGRFLIRLGGRKQVTEAVDHLRRALEVDPGKYDVRFELVAAYRGLGETAQASNQLDFLWDARPSDPRVFYTSALLATDRDDLNAAIKDFKEAVRRDPTFFSGWQDLGVAYIKLKRWEEAVETFTELVRLRPDSVEAAYLKALSLYNDGKVEEAEREVRRGLRLNAGAAEAHTLLGIILASRGNANSEAIDALSQAVALNAKSFDAHFYLGRTFYSVKDYAGAVRELRLALELDRRHAEARFFLGTALEAAGESNLAMAEYQELLKIEPESVYGQLGLGALLVREGKTDQAIAALRQAVTKNVQNFEAHFALGHAYILAGQFAQAVESLRTATSLAAYRADAHYQLGLALKRLGRAEEAALEFATVDKLNREFRTGINNRQ